MIFLEPPPSMAEVEKQLIVHTLRYYRWNKSQAAQSLGFTIKTLYNKLAAYGWDRWNGLDGEGAVDWSNHKKRVMPQEDQDEVKEGCNPEEGVPRLAGVSLD